MIIATLAGRLLVFKVHTDLTDERANSLNARNTKPWDKVLSPAMAITPLLILMVAGLNGRFHWSAELGIGLQVTGLVLAIAGYALATRAMLANRFYSGSYASRRIRYRLIPGIW